MPRVGMVGGGQLARMTHQAAIPLGQTLRVLSVSADDSAALVTPDVMIGDHTDLDALRRFAQGCDVVTFDHEHVPGEHIRTLVAEGHAVYPGADALQYAQDKALMRTRLAELGVPVPAFEVLAADDPARSGADRRVRRRPRLAVRGQDRPRRIRRPRRLGRPRAGRGVRTGSADDRSAGAGGVRADAP